MLYFYSIQASSGEIYSCAFCEKRICNPDACEKCFCSQPRARDSVGSKEENTGPPCDHCGENLVNTDAIICNHCGKPHRPTVLRNVKQATSSSTQRQIFGPGANTYSSIIRELPPKSLEHTEAIPDSSIIDDDHPSEVTIGSALQRHQYSSNSVSEQNNDLPVMSNSEKTASKLDEDKIKAAQPAPQPLASHQPKEQVETVPDEQNVKVPEVPYKKPGEAEHLLPSVSKGKGKEKNTAQSQFQPKSSTENSPQAMEKKTKQLEIRDSVGSREENTGPPCDHCGENLVNTDAYICNHCGTPHRPTVLRNVKQATNSSTQRQVFGPNANTRSSIPGELPPKLLEHTEAIPDSSIIDGDHSSDVTIGSALQRHQHSSKSLSERNNELPVMSNSEKTASKNDEDKIKAAQPAPQPLASHQPKEQVETVPDEQNVKVPEVPYKKPDEPEHLLPGTSKGKGKEKNTGQSKSQSKSSTENSPQAVEQKTKHAVATERYQVKTIH